MAQQAHRVKSSDRRVQSKIDKLSTDTRQLLLKFLDPRTTNQLAGELLRAAAPDPRRLPTSLKYSPTSGEDQGGRLG